MAFTVFYSWQSNLPDETNKELIQGALSEAANDLNNDDSITIDTIIERDTKGVSGSPHIVKAILDKIDRCDLFVADVSIINSHDKIGRKTPNPNVLIELGYALHRLGFEGVVLVMNKYYGEPIELPFDLPKHKVTLYTLSIENIDNTACKKYLKEEFIEAFKLGIDEHKKDIHAHQNPKWEETYHAVVDKKINAPILIDEYIKQLISDINDINPKYSDQASDLECIPFLTSAIESAINLVSNFCEVCEIIALANNMSYCLRLLHALSKILEFYNLRQQLSTRAIQFDLFKVIGHQLFVIFYSYLMQERQFALIASLLLEKYDISNATNYRFTQVDYRYYSMRTSILFHSESNDLYHHAPRHSNIRRCPRIS